MIKIEGLPVYKHRVKIIEALKENQVIVVESPTGSGKTTGLPKILYDAGFTNGGKIGVTQPRRIAAVSVSHFLAGNYGESVPGLVGYKMRFVDQTVPRTKIIIMTDGILLQELKADSFLKEYDVIMVDEAHERSLNIDFILGLLKKITRERPELKVVISSATINATLFSEYFNSAPIITIDAKMFPVRIDYSPPEFMFDFQSTLSKIGEIIGDIEEREEKGDVLIFLSGENQIKECIAYLEQYNRKKNMVFLPLYSRLSREEQEKVFDNYRGKRKVVIATNIAETSVTIDGIKFVIDPGFAKLNFYNSKNYTSSLIEVPISKASCNQRRGRAGRTAPGVCYRLYTEDEYEKREMFTREEIYRRDLSEVVLRMIELGIKDIENFDFISNPGKNKVEDALKSLELLNAIDENRELTSTGKLMVQFPIIPRISRMIVASILDYPDVIEEVLIASAFINDRAPFLLPHGLEYEARKAHHHFRDKMGDFLSYLKIFKSYESAKDKEGFCDRYYLDQKGMAEIFNVKNQLQEIVSKLGVPIQSGGSVAHYLKAVSKGLIQFVCRRTSGSSYKSMTARGIKIHPGSVMYRQKPDFIVAGEIMKTSQMYAMSVSPLKVEWLKEISSELYRVFTGEGKQTQKKEKKTRDYTNYVKIGDERFEITIIKHRKKIVLLPFDKLSRVISRINLESLPKFKGLKGKVLIDDYEIMSGMNLSRILKLFPLVRYDGLLEDWPKGVQFDCISSTEELIRFVPNVMKLCRKSRNSKKLGFLTLVSDGKGLYWFRSYKNPLQSMEESLSTLELLMDENIKTLTNNQSEMINSTYRRIMEYLNK